MVGPRQRVGFPKAIANPIINYGYFQPDQVFFSPSRANSCNFIDTTRISLFFGTQRYISNQLDRLRARLGLFDKPKYFVWENEV